MKTITAVLAAGLALVPLAAGAQTYRCTGKDGKRYYGQSLPPQCIGMPAELLNSSGMVIKRIDPQASAGERAAKDAEDEERKKREAISKEEGRRNRALLATYTSERDIEEARVRALRDNQIAIKEIEARIGAIKKRQSELKKDFDFYQGKNKPPANLAEDMQNAEMDVTAQEGLLAAKKQEVDSINSRYDEDRKRYVQLTKGVVERK